MFSFERFWISHVGEFYFLHPAPVPARLIAPAGRATAGFVLVAGLEGFLFLGREVVAVIDAPRPEEYAVTLFHVHFQVVNINQPDPLPLASIDRVLKE